MEQIQHKLGQEASGATTRKNILSTWSSSTCLVRKPSFDLIHIEVFLFPVEIFRRW